jgi:hypothetical protein
MATPGYVRHAAWSRSTFLLVCHDDAALGTEVVHLLAQADCDAIGIRHEFAAIPEDVRCARATLLRRSRSAAKVKLPSRDRKSASARIATHWSIMGTGSCGAAPDPGPLLEMPFCAMIFSIPKILEYETSFAVRRAAPGRRIPIWHLFDS